MQLAKDKPGSLNYASAGVGSPAHLAGEMLNLLAGIKLTHVPYKGAGFALLDIIAGNAHVIMTSPIAAGAPMAGGRVRALASTGSKRNPMLPELPTVADAVAGYEITQSWGIAAPARTSPEIVQQLSAEIMKAVAQPTQGPCAQDRGRADRRRASGVRSLHGKGATPARRCDRQDRIVLTD